MVTTSHVYIRLGPQFFTISRLDKIKALNFSTESTVSDFWYLKRVWRYLTDRNRNDKIYFWKLFTSFGFTWCQNSPNFFLAIFGHQQLTFGHFRFLADFLLAWIQKWKIAIEWPKMTLDRWKFRHNIIGHIKTQSKACF